MLLITKMSTSKNLVKLESIGSSTISTRGWGVALADFGDVIRVGMQFVEHVFGKQSDIRL